MTTEKFIQELQEEVFTDTNPELITLNTNFKDLDEWDSLIALSLIAHFDMNLGKKISAEQIKDSITIHDLYKIAKL
jgi:acyl carrier protein